MRSLKPRGCLNTIKKSLSRLNYAGRYTIMKTRCVKKLTENALNEKK